MNSWPRRIGTASCRWVRPDLIMWSNSLPLAAKALQDDQHRVKLSQLHQAGDAHGSGKDVVGRLGHVHVIVRVDRLVFAALAAKRFVRQVREHFIGVHIVGSARTRLDRVDSPLVEELAVQDAVGCGNNCVRPLGVKLAEVAIDFGRGALDEHCALTSAGCGSRPVIGKLRIARAVCAP